MNTTYRVTAEQFANLRNNIIISEALGEYESANNTADSELAADYKDFAMANINKKPSDPKPFTHDAQDSVIYGEITKALYNYSQTYSLPSKVAVEISKETDNISEPLAKQFLEKLLYGIYRMSKDPSQNVAFERLLATIGARMSADLLTKDNIT